MAVQKACHSADQDKVRLAYLGTFQEGALRVEGLLGKGLLGKGPLGKGHLPDTWQGRWGKGPIHHPVLVGMRGHLTVGVHLDQVQAQALDIRNLAEVGVDTPAEVDRLDLSEGGIRAEVGIPLHMEVGQEAARVVHSDILPDTLPDLLDNLAGRHYPETADRSWTSEHLLGLL